MNSANFAFPEFSEVVAPASQLCYLACKRSNRERVGRGGEGMRRVVLVLAAMALALLLASGVALAVNKVGTSGPDTLREPITPTTSWAGALTTYSSL